MRKRRTSPFTLLELVAVLAIVAVVLGLALPAVGRIPVFLTLEGAAHPVQELLQDAGIRALCGGRTVTVAADRDEETGILTFSFTATGAAGIYSPPSTAPARVEPPVVATFPELRPDDRIEYRFFPGGGAAGPELVLSLRGRSLRLGVSPLTGLVYRREEAGE